MRGTPDRETSWFMSTPCGVEVVLARVWILDCSLSSAVSYQKRPGSIIIDMNTTRVGGVTLRTRHIIPYHALPPNVWLAGALAQR